jgi:hypothetical protein
MILKNGVGNKPMSIFKILYNAAKVESGGKYER